MNLGKIAAELRCHGLDQLAVLDHQQIAEHAVLREFRSVIVIGNSGPAFWRRIPAAYHESRDPVDEYAVDVVAECMSRHTDAVTWQVLFPNTAAKCPPLQKLGSQAGWHYDSPLGLGINPRWGLWFAYRAVIGVSIDLQRVTMAGQHESPCLSCESQACVTHCPGDALEFGSLPDLKACARYRLSRFSACAQSCLSRLACPVSPDLRYDEAQISYHYRLALPALAEWLMTSEDSDR